MFRFSIHSSAKIGDSLDRKDFRKKKGTWFSFSPLDCVRLMIVSAGFSSSWPSGCVLFGFYNLNLVSSFFFHFAVIRDDGILRSPDRSVSKNVLIRRIPFHWGGRKLFLTHHPLFCLIRPDYRAKFLFFRSVTREQQWNNQQWNCCLPPLPRSTNQERRGMITLSGRGTRTMGPESPSVTTIRRASKYQVHTLPTIRRASKYKVHKLCLPSAMRVDKE